MKKLEEAYCMKIVEIGKKISNFKAKSTNENEFILKDFQDFTPRAIFRIFKLFKLLKICKIFKKATYSIIIEHKQS